MDILRRIWEWSGIADSVEVRNYAAHRNMVVILMVSPAMFLFSLMLTFCVFTGTPTSVNGFDEVAYSTPGMTLSYRVFMPLCCTVAALLFLYAFTYRRQQRCKPQAATAISMLFAMELVWLWAAAGAGTSTSQQMLVFASLEFLVAGLMVFRPHETLIYYLVSFGSFALFQASLGKANPSETVYQLAYLAIMATVVSWIVYSLHHSGVLREIRISEQSRRDELTGAKNRHYLRADFPTLLGQHLFVMFCDVDDFKHFNDDYDHNVGDEQLRAFFFALREAFGDECVYRYGGDEFLVVSPDFGTAEFRAKAAKVREQLVLAKIRNNDAHLRYSGGYVDGTPQNEADFREMMRQADDLLLQAKRQGKDRVIGVKAGQLS